MAAMGSGCDGEWLQRGGWWTLAVTESGCDGEQLLRGGRRTLAAAESVCDGEGCGPLRRQGGSGALAAMESGNNWPGEGGNGEGC